MLRVHQISIYLAGMIERRTNRFRRNFVEGDAKNLFRIGRRNLFLRLGLFFHFGRGLGVLFLPTRRAGFLLDEFRRLREHHRQVSRNRLAFAVRVARQIDRISRVRDFAQVVDDFQLAVDDLQRRLENLHVVQRHRFAYRLHLGLLAALLRANLLLWRTFLLVRLIGQTNAYGLLRQVEDVADGGFDDVVAAQILIDGFRLCRRLYNDERTCHSAVLTPYL